MMTVIRTFSGMPEEFSVSDENGNILCAEWREGIRQDKETKQYSAACHYIPTLTDLSYTNIVELLAECRYTAGEEVALMRRDITDPERVEHEEYIIRVKAYADAFVRMRGAQ